MKNIYENAPDLSKECVVGGARVTCSCGQGPGNTTQSATRLVVDRNEDGSNTIGPYIIATEKDCQKGKNLFPFQRCYSEHYMDMVRTLYDIGNGNEKKTYAKLMSDYGERGYSQCLHQLEEVWFEANEKLVVSNMYNMEERLLKGRTLWDDTIGDIRVIKVWLGLLYEQLRLLAREKKGTGYCYDYLLDVRYEERNRRIKGVEGRIWEAIQDIEKRAVRFGYAENLFLKSEEFLSNYTEVRNDARVIWEELESLAGESIWDIGGINREVTVSAPSDALRKSAVNPERTPGAIAREVGKLRVYSEIKRVVGGFLADLEDIVRSIKEWTQAPDAASSNTLTTDSFMVCRCGGILSFIDSGQEYIRSFNTLYKRTEEFVGAFLSYYQRLYESQELLVGEEDRKQLKYAYRDAVEGVERLWDYLTENILDEENMRSCVYLEFVGKSVGEEERSKFMALLSLGTLLPNVFGVGSKLVAGCISLEHLDRVAKGVGEEAGEEEYQEAISLVLKDEKDATFTIASLVQDLIGDGDIPKGLEMVNNVGNALTLCSILESLSYDIYDNWIERLRIYVFTEEYMFYGEQYLKQVDWEYQKEGEPRYLKWVERRDYLNERRGSNVEWGDHPGIMYGTQNRVGEKTEREKAKQRTVFKDALEGIEEYE